MLLIWSAYGVSVIVISLMYDICFVNPDLVLLLFDIINVMLHVLSFYQAFVPKYFKFRACIFEEAVWANR